MKLTYLLPALLAFGCISGSALGAQNEREKVNKERAKRVEYKRDERREDKKQRIAYKKDKPTQRKKEKREQRKETKRKIAHYKHDKRKYTYLKNKRHNVVTYRPGRYFSNIPRNSASIRFNGISFTFSDGIYYRKAKSGYHVVKPPRGLRVRSLPKHYSYFKRHNTTYYTYQNVYYVADNNGYRVVDAPNVIVNKAVKVGTAINYELGQTYDTLPITAEAVTINEQQYFKYDDIYFLPQISEDEIKYLAINLG
ncbi:DUF6515 family protein [Pseudoalteromonas sp. MMG007]|uniref:DUF6515 family protein n=1 Tax=Pseudoalteromonas sp. MMG007 TaxID=2822684 RepID=UPI001B392E68|nr:DUF6515 family protein [Pseudoalteromonas sp. MMG007]MBQ4856918.1 hypothetical protein [Pseudoalteromonas sp. MMG007]